MTLERTEEIGLTPDHLLPADAEGQPIERMDELAVEVELTRVLALRKAEVVAVEAAPLVDVADVVDRIVDAAVQHEEVGPFEDYPSESFDRVMQVNVKGTLLACQVIGARMAHAGRGSSCAGSRPAWWRCLPRRQQSGRDRSGVITGMGDIPVNQPVGSRPRL